MGGAVVAGLGGGERPFGSGVSGLRGYFSIAEEDVERLRRLAEPARRQVDRWVQDLARHITAFPDIQAVLSAPEVFHKMQEGHRLYLHSLFPPSLDREYVDFRQRIAEVHDRIGVLPWMHSTGMALLFDRMQAFILQETAHRPLEEVQGAVGALAKVLLLDMALMWEEYQRRREERLEWRARELEALHRFTSARVDDLLRAQEALQRSLERVRLVAEAARLNYEEPNPREGAQRVLGAVLGHLNLETAELWAVDPPEGRVVLVAREGLFPAEVGEVRALPLGQGLPGLAASHGQPFITLDLAREPQETREALKGTGLKFYASVPVRAQAGVVAVLCVGSLRPHSWGEEHSSLLEDVGRVIGRRTTHLLLEEFRLQEGGGGGTDPRRRLTGPR